MKLNDVMRVLTTGELDAIKQAYRQGYDWRKKLHSMHPPADKDVLRTWKQGFFWNP